MAGTPIVSEFHDVVGADISFAVSSRRPSMWKLTLANAVAHRANFKKAQLALNRRDSGGRQAHCDTSGACHGVRPPCNFALYHHVLNRAVGRRSMSVASFRPC